MAGGADSIDDLDLLRHGAMSELFGGVRAPPRNRTALATNRQAQRQGRALPPTSKPDRSTSIMSRPTPINLAASETNPNEKLTISELCAELKVARSTFYEWRQKHRWLYEPSAPREPLPMGAGNATHRLMRDGGRRRP
jgi:hypothetical protein